MTVPSAFPGLYFGMPLSGGIIAQVKPAAGVLTPLFVVPSGASCLIVRVIVCRVGTGNQSSKYRQRNIVSGEAYNDRQWAYYDEDVQQGQSLSTLGIGQFLVFNAGDSVEVSSDDGHLAITAFGMKTIPLIQP